MLKVRDRFRHARDKGGFTWNMGKCFSRPDYVFVLESMLRFSKGVSTDWAYDRSDHAPIILELNIPTINHLGPGMVRVSTSVLENQKLLEQIKIKLEVSLSQAPSNWNPNLRLEFLKVGIHTTFAEAARQYNRKKCKHEMIEGE
jgi:hypothetical protein